MEAAAASPRAKKRRSEAPGISLAASTPGDESHSPASPPGTGGGEEDGVDRISGLPDAMLREIISLLSTKDAARIQTLASRWRHIWSSATLNLDSRDLPSDDEALADAVARILSAHPGPGRRFCIPPHHLHDRPATVDAWLRSPALDNLQELDFWEDGYYWQRPEIRKKNFFILNKRPEFPPAPLPASAFRFTATLRVATFSKCHLVDDTVEALHFPQLTQLALEDALVSEGSLHTMISSCPVLECLLLNNSFGFRCVRISSNSLRSIGVGARRHDYQIQLRNLIIVDAPCLERLIHLQLQMDVHVSVISAPKLETLGCLNDGGMYPTRFVFGTTAIEGMRIVKFTTVVRNIKILAVKSWNVNLDIVIELMKCFPCLEKLYIKFLIAGDMNLWRRKHRNFIKSSDIRLKTVVLEQYWGTKSQVNFASFFILNARQLELMRLEVDKRVCSDTFVATQHGMLQMHKRASRYAQLHITTNTCDCYVSHIKHVRDLSITDPFKCTC